jgi:F420-dependent oxidoreductase-like protein
MQDTSETRPLRERVGLRVWPIDPATILPRDPATTLTIMSEVEDAGVPHIWLPSGPPWSPDLFIVLAAAATRTTRVTLGTSIIPISTRHPVLLALQALSLSGLAPHRLRLGIGTGSPELAKRVYGVEMGSPLAYLREYLQVLQPLLRQGEVHHHGHFFTTEVSLSARGQIPVFIAALGPRAFRLAGEIADGALPYLCPIPYLLNTALPALSEGAANAGRPRPPLVAYVPVVLTRDRATALQVGRQAVAFQTTLKYYRNMFAAAGFSLQEIDGVSDSLVESLLIFGDEDKVKDRLLELLAAGVDELTVDSLTVSDAAQERMRLARLIGHL